LTQDRISQRRPKPLAPHGRTIHLGRFCCKSRKSNNPKISRKLIFGLLCCCVAFQRHYGGPYRFWMQTMWPLPSPRVKRISGSKKFRSSGAKDFLPTTEVTDSRIFYFASPHIGTGALSSFSSLRLLQLSGASRDSGHSVRPCASPSSRLIPRAWSRGCAPHIPGHQPVRHARGPC
jgi:hypothetical protein